MVSQKPKYCKSFEKNSHWRKLSMIMVWERYCNASPKPELFLFSLFIFSFISQLIWVRLGWNFHQMIFHTETSKLMYNWSFLFVVLHKPTLLPSNFKVPLPKVPCTTSHLNRPRTWFDVYDLIIECPMSNTTPMVYDKLFFHISRMSLGNFNSIK